MKTKFTRTKMTKTTNKKNQVYKQHYTTVERNIQSTVRKDGTIRYRAKVQVNGKTMYSPTMKSITAARKERKRIEAMRNN